MENTKYYLAVDIGASSGRHILAHMENGKMVCEEIYRFYNGNDLLLADKTNAGEADGRQMPPGSHRVWNTERLFSEIIAGMKACAGAGKIPVSMAIDTWAVDYVLLDENDRPAAPCYAYRDSRTDGIDAGVYQIIPEKELYARTGIQKAIFNTIYQLAAAKTYEPETLKRAKTFLMIPDYFNFLLTGVKCQEYTNATTTQLVDPKTGDWDFELIERLGFPADMFQEIRMPGESRGGLLPGIQKQVGFDCNVMLCASHDTASAVMSVPAESDDVLYISSGTWSLLGCERMEPDCGSRARAANFTNEGGYDRRFRFLKNIMGLWMIQSVQKEFIASDPKGDYSFGNICERASKESISSVVDVNDERFLAPASMSAEVRSACADTGQKIPVTPWEISRVIYRSLAGCYRKAVLELEELTGVKYEVLHIVGGGANALWLNELTARSTGLTVLAGPSEATAAGCLGAQMIADGVFEDLKDFRRCVRNSFEINENSCER